MTLNLSKRRIAVLAVVAVAASGAGAYAATNTTNNSIPSAARPASVLCQLPKGMEIPYPSSMAQVNAICKKYGKVLP